MASADADGDSSHLGFLRHAEFRWAKLALLLSAVSIAAYVWHPAPEGANGGTWLGYTLGGIGAFLILCLLWLGVRKRRYRSGLGTVKGWTSAHVYLGLSLLVVASLHCGFQFGLNVHTLGYVLMVLVIISGLWGLFVYDRLPSRIGQLRAGGTRDAWIEEVFDLNDQAIKLADRVAPDVHQRIVASAEKLRIGGSLRQQLFGRHSAGEAESLRATLETRIAQLRADAARDQDPQSQSTAIFMAGQLQHGVQDSGSLQKLLDLLSRRNALVARINQDISLHARLQVWLLVHVPLSLALLAALIAHVFSVFFYW
ncbi:MAG: hypothetical protein Q8Q73_01920 [Stagnimonas sp.]|nr:hypothetical protein [Stagnimonas sp.]